MWPMCISPGVSLDAFEKVDAILDAGIGTTAIQRQLRGQVKYDTSTSEMMIYLAHG